MHYRITLTVHNPHGLCSFAEQNTSALLSVKGRSRAGRGALAGLERQCLELNTFSCSSGSLARTCTVFGTSSLKGWAPRSCNNKAVLCLFKQNSSSEAESSPWETYLHIWVIPHSFMWTFLRTVNPVAGLNLWSCCGFLASSQLQTEKNSNQ